MFLIIGRVRYFRGRVPNFDQSDARKQYFLASDWSKLDEIKDKNPRSENWDPAFVI